MIDSAFEQATQARRRGDEAFEQKQWSLAGSYYWQCTQILDISWKEEFQPAPKVLKLGQGLAQLFYYALVQQGKLEEAVLALENGIARYLARLARVNDFGWRLSDDSQSTFRPSADGNVLAYVDAAEKLTEALARVTHRSVSDDVPLATRLHVSMTSILNPSELEEVYKIENEFMSIAQSKEGRAQFDIVISIMKGQKPVGGADYTNALLKRMINLLVRQREIFRRYDFSSVKDDADQIVEEARRDLKRLAAVLPDNWLKPSWEEIQTGQGTKADRGGNFVDEAPLPYIYLVSAKHGSFSLTVLPQMDKIPREVQCHGSSLFQMGELASTSPAMR